MNAPVKLSDLAGLAKQISRATPRADALASLPTPHEPPLDANTDALRTPRKGYDFAATARDIDACAVTDALIDAQDALNEAKRRCADCRALPPAVALLIFGSERAWNESMGRQGLAISRQINALYQMKRAAGMSCLEAGAVPQDEDCSKYSIYGARA